MVEDTERERDLVKVYSPVHPGEHVSRRGEDIARKSLVVAEGEVLSPAKVGALAAIGMSRAHVYAKPRVSILTTGDEVVPPGKPIRAGQVYDINSHTMASVVRENGGEPVSLGRVSDRLESLRAALRKALANRVVSTIGRVEFHTVRIVDGQAVPAYKESGAITSMAHADGYIEIPANVDLLEKGEPVRVTLF